jgi:chromosome segregation ATPase
MRELIERFEALVRKNIQLDQEIASSSSCEEELRAELREIKSDLNEKRAQCTKLEELIDQQASTIEVLESQLEMVGGKPTGSF